MKYFILALWVVLLLPSVVAQAPQDVQDIEDVARLRDSEERERIRRTRANEQARFALLEARCYERFAVNDCLAKLRSHKRELMGDLRRQEISLNDAQRKRRATEQLLRSDERASRTR